MSYKQIFVCNWSVNYVIKCRAAIYNVIKFYFVLFSTLNNVLFYVGFFLHTIQTNHSHIMATYVRGWVKLFLVLFQTIQKSKKIVKWSPYRLNLSSALDQRFLNFLISGTSLLTFTFVAEPLFYFDNTVLMRHFVNWLFITII